MREQVLDRKASRREVLKLSGLGLVGGATVGALAPGRADAVDQAFRISHAAWVHGHSMQIEYPDRVPYQRRTGMSFDIEGQPGTDNWFHFAIPTPVIINDVRLRVDSVMLTFRTFSVDAFVAHVHVYDGGNRIAQHDNVNLTMDQPFVRLLVPDRPLIFSGVGISLGVGFGVEPMDHRMEFVAAGCDFSVVPLE